MDLSLAGKKALVLGVANERSLAWAIARELKGLGAEVALTYAGPALEKRVRPLAAELGATQVLACDVSRDDDIAQLAAALTQAWGRLDVLIHGVAFAQREDLEGRFVDTTREGFRIALDISAYSLVALCRALEPLMVRADGASVVTLSYYGAEKVVPNYNVMGVAKAALEASVRYLANDLGPKRIRVNAISAGPVKTLAAAGIRGFRDMLSSAAHASPLRETITAEDVGALGAFLAAPAARHITGATYHLDSGAHAVAMQTLPIPPSY